VWIKSWAELIRDCDARLKFVQEKLRIEVSAEEIQERIARLRTAVLKSTDQPQFDQRRTGELPFDYDSEVGGNDQQPQHSS
jgi:hypothetical protein